MYTAYYYVYNSTDVKFLPSSAWPLRGIRFQDAQINRLLKLQFTLETHKLQKIHYLLHVSHRQAPVQYPWLITWLLSNHVVIDPVNKVILCSVQWPVKLAGNLSSYQSLSAEARRTSKYAGLKKYVRNYARLNYLHPLIYNNCGGYVIIKFHPLPSI